MKLLVPYVDEVDPVDARLVALAAHLGITAESVLLTPWNKSGSWRLDKAASNEEFCFVMNPRVLERWAEGNHLRLEALVAGLWRFSHLLLYAPRPKAFDAELICLLSGGELRSVREMTSENTGYEVAQDAEDVCGSFAGLVLDGPTPLTEYVFLPGLASSTRRELVMLRSAPFMALVRLNATQVLFLGSQDVMALSTRVEDSRLTPYFSRLAVPAMALRYIFAGESWRPAAQHACVIVDDPLLRRSYGFLRFKDLLDLMDRHNFHTSIAFIPHNWRRSSPAVARMFRERRDRLSLCFHGNDHTGAEFASEDPALLHGIVGTAEYRMNAHHSLTGVECGRIMVFPQGKFSTAAMAVLKAHGFDAAVNTGFQPYREEVSMTLSDLIQPAVLRYAGFALFLRDYSVQTHAAEIAFKLFFGRPVLIVEHHDIFRHPEPLLAAVERINAVAPRINWVNVDEAVRKAYFWKRGADGTTQIRAYSSAVHLWNSAASPANFRVEWAHCRDGMTTDQRTRPSEPVGPVSPINVSLDSGASTSVSLGETREEARCGHLGFQRTVWGFVRRRLSEVRDNYLSRTPVVLDVTIACHRRLLRYFS